MRHTIWLGRALGICVLAMALAAASGCGSADDKGEPPGGATPKVADSGDTSGGDQGEDTPARDAGTDEPSTPDPSESEPDIPDPFATPEPEEPQEPGEEMPPAAPEVPDVGLDGGPGGVPPVIEPEPGAVPPVLEPEPGPETGPDVAEGEPSLSPLEPPGEGDLRTEVEAELQERAEPLVENPETLKPLAENRPIWIDMNGGQLVMVGEVCQTDAPLELFACLKNTKEHEAVLTIDVQAITAHAGLLALGAEPGHPVSWDPVYNPATGTQIELLVRWKDAGGDVKNARAQDWVYDVENKKAMEHPWVFAGSGFWVDEETGRKHYKAEGGDFICVSNFSSAMLDLPIESSQANTALMFKAYTERIPPLGTPVTVLLRPKLDEQEKKQPEPDAAPDE